MRLLPLTAAMIAAGCMPSFASRLPRFPPKQGGARNKKTSTPPELQKEIYDAAIAKRASRQARNLERAKATQKELL